MQLKVYKSIQLKYYEMGLYIGSYIGDFIEILSRETTNCKYIFCIQIKFKHFSNNHMYFELNYII